MNWKEMVWDVLLVLLAWRLGIGGKDAPEGD